MKEGKELLTTIIQKRLDEIAAIDQTLLLINNVNIVDLQSRFSDSYEALAELDDLTLETLCDKCQLIDSFVKDLKQIRDLFLGKKNYNLQVTLAPKYREICKNFNKTLTKYIKDNNLPTIDYQDLKERLNLLKEAIDNKHLITDFDTIKEIVKDYSEVTYDNLLASIFDFINRHNIAIINKPKKLNKNFYIQNVTRLHIDEELQEIFDKLQLTIDDIPAYLLIDLKKIDIHKMYETFLLAKRNKAEDGGILHLFTKNNNLGKLILLMYSDELTIKKIIEITRDNSGNVDVPLLKIACNYLLSTFVSIKNDHYTSKTKTFVENMNMLRELGVNYRSLIKKTPSFMLMNNEIIEFTLNYLESYGADKRKLINKCYKIFANNPTLLIDNLEVVRRYNISTNDLFANDNSNYIILKCYDLDNLLKQVENYTQKEVKSIHFSTLNKMLIRFILEK